MGPSFTLTRIADTTDRFSDFAPYVASVSDAGTVAFQATLPGGVSEVFTGDGGPVTPVAGARGAISHPDLNRAGSICFYAELGRGGQGVVLVRDGRLQTLADGSGPFARIGPLGPTMNEAGAVAFRADLKSGESGIFVATAGSIVSIADTGGPFGAFQGLPVINKGGTVVFRADLKGGGQGIYAGSGGALATVADTRGHFSALGLFPCMDDKGTVVFAATLDQGGSGVFTATDGVITAVADTSGAYEAFRGALINNAGTVFFFATPRGGKLGVFRGPDPRADRIFCLGDPLLGSTVAELALNSVSVNDADQLAVRVRLADSRELILRVDPAAASGGGLLR